MDTTASPDTLVNRADPSSNPSEPTDYDDNSWKVLGGGMESNAVDLARFGWAALDGQIVSRTSRLWNTRTGTATYTSDGSEAPIVGLGWEMDAQYASHGGSWRGARSELLLAVNDGISIAILSNRRNQRIIRYRTTAGGFRVRTISALAGNIMDLVKSR